MSLYTVKTEVIATVAETNGEAVTMEAAYNPAGYYIGSPKDAAYICDELGIKPEPLYPDSNVCSIGYSEKDGKWYGWSHRAIYGFQVGDIVENEDHVCAVSGWTEDYLMENPEKDLRLPVGFEAKTVEDVKRMARAFADAVG